MQDRHIHNLKSLRATLAALPADAFVVGFFIHIAHVSQDEWLNPLARQCSAAGYVTVGIRTPLSKECSALDDADCQAILEPGEIESLDRINVFIISDKDNWAAPFPQKSRVLGCYHAFEAAYDTSFPCMLYNCGLIDGWLYSAPFSDTTRALVAKLWTGVASPEASHRKNRHFHCIPVGYPRMAVLARSLNALPQPRDAILYAPTEMEAFLEHGGERVKTCGMRLVRTLLNCFPDYTVIFRPFKRNISHPDVERIRAAFAGAPRFVFDDSPDRAPAFARAALLITDLSLIANTFSFSTLRPSVFFQPWTSGKRPGVHYTYAHSYTELVGVIRAMLADSEAVGERIRRFRDAHAMPVESAFADIAGLLRDFYEDRPRPEWITVERCTPELTPGDAELARRALGEPTTTIPGVAATMAVFSRPRSPLLLALALHTGMEICPDTWHYLTLNDLAAAALGHPMPVSLYRDTPAADVRTLYRMALLQCLRNGDGEGAALVESLLAGFDALFPPAPEGTAPVETAADEHAAGKAPAMRPPTGCARD